MIGSGARAILGFVAAAIAVLTFHQAMWALLLPLDLPGMGMPPPYPTAPVPPWGAPYRGSSVLPWPLRRPVRAGPAISPSVLGDGLVLGIIAVLLGFFVVAPLKGVPVAWTRMVNNWARSLLINGFWGLRRFILPSILPRRRRYV